MIDDDARYNILALRAERLIEGDIIWWAHATWRVRRAEKTSPTRIRLVLEPVETDSKPIDTIVERDRVLLAMLLV